MATTCKLIAKTTLGSSASSIEFTSIPGTYTDLLIAVSLRTDRAEFADSIKLTFNGVTTTTYSSRFLYGSGSTATSGSESSVAYIVLSQLSDGGSATANTFGNGEIYIPNYAGSTSKSVSSSSVSENNATSAFMGVSAGLWTGTDAITSVKLVPYTGPNWVSGSTAYLYGITKSA